MGAIETTDRTAIQLWDSVTEMMLWTWSMPADCREHLWSVHFVPGDKSILVEMGHRTDIKHHLFLIDAKSGKQLQTIDGGEIRSISPDGRFVSFGASVDKDFYVEVRDLSSGETIVKEKRRKGYRGRHACFSADSKIFACNLDDMTIEFFDLQTRKRLGPARRHTAYVRQMTFAPSGGILAAAYNDSTVIFWDAKLEITSPWDGPCGGCQAC